MPVAAPGVPGHGNCISPFLRTTAPVQLRGLKTPPAPAVFSIPGQTTSFLTIFPHRVARTPLALPPPALSHSHPTGMQDLEPESYPSGTRVPAPLPHTVPCTGGDMGDVPLAVCSAPFQHDCKHTSQIAQPFFCCCLSHSAGNWHL